MMLTTLIMGMYEIKDNAYSLFARLLGLCGVIRLHIHVALVDLDWGYE